MALPSTFTVSEAIDEAFERCLISPANITPQHIVSARRSIRLMLDDWNNDSIDFWKVSSGQQHTQTLDEDDFTLPAGTIDVLDMGVLRNDYLTPLVIISRSDWFAIPDKATAQGMANRVWVERLTTGLTAHIYPKAPNSTDILVYDAMVRFNDSSALGSAADVPPLWNEAFTAGLTAALAFKFARPLWSEAKAEYGGPGVSTGAYARARMGNRERGDTVMVVHKARRQRR